MALEIFLSAISMALEAVFQQCPLGSEFWVWGGMRASDCELYFACWESKQLHAMC